MKAQKTYREIANISLPRRQFCKLTTAEGTTRPYYPNKTLWGPGIAHSAPGRGPLCTSGWIHYYAHPLLASLLNRLGPNFASPKCWKIRAWGRRKYSCGKWGAQHVRTVREVPLPEISLAQKVEIAIRAALLARSVAARSESDNSSAWVKWAESWLSGSDRSAASACAASRFRDYGREAPWDFYCRCAALAAADLADGDQNFAAFNAGRVLSFEIWDHLSEREVLGIALSVLKRESPKA